MTSSTEMNKYQKWTFWILVSITCLSILTYVVNPYLPFIRVFDVQTNHLYLLIIILMIPLISLLKKIKWGENEFEFKADEIQKSIKDAEDIGSKLDFGKYSKDIRETIQKIETKGDYTGGIIYFFNRIEECLRKKIDSPSNVNMTYLINIALQKNIITAYDFHDLNRLKEIRNALVHGKKIKSGELDLIKILYFSADIYDKLGRRLK